MKITAEPRSDQWNADDLVQGPRTFVIAGVKEGTAEQKYDIQLEGSDRVWRPPVTVLRILLVAWGDEATTWVGRRATLYRDESIRFGPTEAPGIRVSHLSHIDKPLTVALTVSRGKRKNFTVAVLAADNTTAPPADPETWITRIAATDTLEALQQVWSDATTARVTGHQTVVDAKDARKKALTV